MKIKLLSLILTLILLFSVMVVADESIIGFNVDSKDSSVTLENDNSVDYSATQTPKTVVIKTKEGGQVVIDNSLLLNTKTEGKGARARSVPVDFRYNLKITDTSVGGGGTDRVLTLLDKENNEVIPRIVLDKDNIVTIKERNGEIWINIKHKGSGFFRKKPLGSTNFILRELSKTEKLKGRFGSIQQDAEVQSIN